MKTTRTAVWLRIFTVLAVAMIAAGCFSTPVHADTTSANASVTVNGDSDDGGEDNGNSNGGGGGGGGGGGSPGNTSLTGYVDSSGRFRESVMCKSSDGRVELYIESETVGLNRMGMPLSFVTIKPDDSPPAAPSQGRIVGEVYTLGPRDSTFSPPALLTIEYDTGDLPKGSNEKNLLIGRWDDDANAWTIMEGRENDTKNKTITVPISRFSQYAVLAYVRLASFSASNLTISPAAVLLGEEVTVSVTVHNQGDLSGTYEVLLQLESESRYRQVTIEGNSSLEVAFNFVATTVGVNNLEISGLRGRLIVNNPPSFLITDISVTPTEAVQGQTVSVSFLVTNTGDVAGTYKIILLQNEREAATREITLYGGEAKRAYFTAVADNTGTCSFSIADNVFDINVVPPASTGEDEVPGLIAGALPEDISGLPSESEAVGNGQANWRLIAIFGGITVVAIILLLLLKITRD